jgi:hypothetical protein
MPHKSAEDQRRDDLREEQRWTRGQKVLFGIVVFLVAISFLAANKDEVFGAKPAPTYQLPTTKHMKKTGAPAPVFYLLDEMSLCDRVEWVQVTIRGYTCACSCKTGIFTRKASPTR